MSQILLNKRKARRTKRTRSKVFGTKSRPRLSVFRSSKHIYAQIINDEKGETLASFSSALIAEKDKKGKTKSEVSTIVGTNLSALAKKQKISSVVFDRGSFRYQGRIKALADAARSGGLNF